MNREKILADLAELLEEDAVRETDVLTDFDVWDSLAVLSIIAYAADTFHKQLSNDDVRSAKTIGGLITLFEQ